MHAGGKPRSLDVHIRSVLAPNILFYVRSVLDSTSFVRTRNSVNVKSSLVLHAFQLVWNSRIHHSLSLSLSLSLQSPPHGAHVEAAMLTLTSPLTPPLLTSTSLSTPTPLRHSKIPTKGNKNKVGSWRCRADFQQDAPFAAAIGACMLSSLVLPNGGSDEDKDSVLDSTDARFAVMGIISFIPYFNWLTWVFAWLDSGKRRYAVYALVYLAPYLRTNMVISPQESWLPIASIIFGIVHVQLEASIRNGDIEKFQLFSKVTDILSSMGKKKDIDYEDHDGPSEEGGERKNQQLPSAEEKARNDIRNWGASKRPSEDHENSTVDADEEDHDDNERRKH